MGYKAVHVAKDRSEPGRKQVSPDPNGSRAQRRAWAKLYGKEVPHGPAEEDVAHLPAHTQS